LFERELRILDLIISRSGRQNLLRTLKQDTTADKMQYFGSEFCELISKFCLYHIRIKCVVFLSDTEKGETRLEWDAIRNSVVLYFSFLLQIARLQINFGVNIEENELEYSHK
jgi:hypothetical protein